MKKCLLILMGCASFSVFSSAPDYDALFKKLDEVCMDEAVKEELQEWQQGLVASRLPHEQVMIKGDTLAHKLVRMGNTAALRILKAVGIDFTVKNAEKMSVKDLAQSLNKNDIVQMLAEESPARSFDDQLVDLVMDCLVPSGNPEEALKPLASLKAFVEANKDDMPAVDNYYPNALNSSYNSRASHAAESLGESLDSYNPRLYRNRDEILKILQPNRPIKDYVSELSDEEEVVDFLQNYLEERFIPGSIAGDYKYDFAELKIIFKACPVYVDYYTHRDGSNLGRTIDDTLDSRLIGLCLHYRMANAENDPDQSKFFELVRECLVGDNNDCNARIDFYVKSFKGDVEDFGSFLTPLFNEDAEQVTLGEFLNLLNADLFPRKKDLEQRIFKNKLISHESVSQKECLENLIIWSIGEPTWYLLVESALPHYKNEAIELDKIILPSGKSVKAVLSATDDAQLLSLKGLFPEKIVAPPIIIPVQPKQQQEQQNPALQIETPKQPSTFSFGKKIFIAAIIGVSLYCVYSYLKKSKHKVAIKLV